MKKLDFNSGWTFRKAEQPPTAAQGVTLPHDAMIHEPRDSAAPGGSDNAFFPGGTYLYEKIFDAPDAAHCEVLFEGVYRNTTVALNGETLATHTYGYTPFSVTLDGKLHEGTNTLTVTVNNTDAPSGRWYTGSGIYRPVSLFTGDKAYIRREGIRVTTLSVNPAQVQVAVEACGGQPAVELLDPSGRVVASGSGADLTLTVPEAQLWSEESPTLYTCRVTLTEGRCALWHPPDRMERPPGPACQWPACQTARSLCPPRQRCGGRLRLPGERGPPGAQAQTSRLQRHPFSP